MIIPAVKKGRDMKISVIGAGHVGGTLGRRWAEAGHEIIFGVREPNSPKMRDLLKAINGTVQRMHRVTSDRESAAAANVVVLAVPWASAQEAIRQAGSLSGKILIDVVNPFSRQTGQWAVGFSTSAAEQIAGWAKGAHVVKAFNYTSFMNMADPVYDGSRVAAFICGDDPEARDVVAGLAEEIGFEPFITGPLYHARFLEALAMLYIDMVYIQKHDPQFAFAVLTRTVEAGVPRAEAAATRA